MVKLLFALLQAPEKEEGMSLKIRKMPKIYSLIKKKLLNI